MHDDECTTPFSEDLTEYRKNCGLCGCVSKNVCVLSSVSHMGAKTPTCAVLNIKWGDVGCSERTVVRRLRRMRFKSNYSRSSFMLNGRNEHGVRVRYIYSDRCILWFFAQSR